MKKHLVFFTWFLTILLPAALFASPTVFPTGTTIYDPDKAWSGYTMIAPLEDARTGQGTTLLIDMNGKVVHRWPLHSYPTKIMPGGFAMGGMTQPGKHLWNSNPKIPTAQAFLGFDLVQMDFEGNIVWKFDKYEQVQDTGKKDSKPYWNARQHHDWQREGSPTGYYAPGMEPNTKGGKTLILSAKGKLGYLNSSIYEVSWDGKVIWEWVSGDHVEEWLKKIGGIEKHMTGKLSEGGQQAHPSIRVINTASYLGPNKWFDQGDVRFHPDNIVCDNTFGDTIFIISRKTGEIVWWVGPDYKEDPQLAHLGFQYHQEPFYTGGMLHNAHMIPKGLPGEGNILVFNNGKPYSSVTEFNPVTKNLVWEYSAKQLGHAPSHSLASQAFFSCAESNAQRLPNGNTLINEADAGRVFEVTKDLETVWEYVNPYKWYKFRGVWSKSFSKNIYRAYRVPYEWVPQLETPEENAVIPPDNADFHIPAEGEQTFQSPY
jgi:hypothetical protein